MVDQWEAWELIMWSQGQWNFSKINLHPMAQKNQTDRTTDGHCNSMTESAQWGRFSENNISRQFFSWTTLNCHISLTVRAFDLISKLRARPYNQISSDKHFLLNCPTNRTYTWSDLFFFFCFCYTNIVLPSACLSNGWTTSLLTAHLSCLFHSGNFHT